jgi:hypothetical protein
LFIKFPFLRVKTDRPAAKATPQSVTRWVKQGATAPSRQRNTNKDLTRRYTTARSPALTRKHRIAHTSRIKTGDIMLELLKIIHFLSFSVAIGAGLANMIVGMRMADMPPAVLPQIGALRLSFGKTSTIGLGLLWLTGITMVLTAPVDPLGDTMFRLKLVAVVLLTLASVLANMTVVKARAVGAPPDAKRMKTLGQASLAMAVLALILAILAFT